MIVEIPYRYSKGIVQMGPIGHLKVRKKDLVLNWAEAAIDKQIRLFQAAAAMPGETYLPSILQVGHNLSKVYLTKL